MAMHACLARKRAIKVVANLSIKERLPLPNFASLAMSNLFGGAGMAQAENQTAKILKDSMGLPCAARMTPRAAALTKAWEMGQASSQVWETPGAVLRRS
mmetsp:Transcript_8780/g.23513  ORF Transcript_8780/g.23513 Transcript_8780/m.23513 type:complete len:99 (-) Transcript_8780:50-346(-)